MALPIPDFHLPSRDEAETLVVLACVYDSKRKVYQVPGVLALSGDVERAIEHARSRFEECRQLMLNRRF